MLKVMEIIKNTVYSSQGDFFLHNKHVGLSYIVW